MTTHLSILTLLIAVGGCRAAGTPPAASCPACPPAAIAERAPSAPAHAAAEPTEPGFVRADAEMSPCMIAAHTQMAMNACAEAEAAHADGRLRARYRAASSAADAEAAALLVDAQLAFHEHRERHCALLADVFRGGSLAPLEHASCVADLTWAHLAALARYAPLTP